MKNIFKSVSCFVFASVLFCSLNVSANTDFELWKQDFYQEALKEGVSKALLDKVLPEMDLLERVIRLDTHKPEYIANFYDYMKTRVEPIRIEKGRKMMKKYPTWLSRVEEKYGVPKQYILAFWGMETNYGSFMGSVDMLDSLATLAYHPRRRRFFTNELIAYLKIVERKGLAAPKIGSWDGGFGNFQFMPTTFLAYAVDGDNNGRRDIVRNIPDAFSSAANYLRGLKWRTNEPWGREILLPKNFDWAHLHMHENKTVGEWEKLGIKPKHISCFPDSEKEITAEFRMPMGKDGPIFLTYPNFKIIMRWNKSSLYAFSIGLLADIIEEKYQPIKAPKGFKPFRTDDIICMQEKLIELGYLSGSADGKVGVNTRTALRSYQKENNLIQDAYPSKEILTKMECSNNEK